MAYIKFRFKPGTAHDVRKVALRRVVWAVRDVLESDPIQGKIDSWLDGACTCTHSDPYDARLRGVKGDFHDPITGACLVINPIMGPCPCNATPPEVLAAQEQYWEGYIRPDFQRARDELRRAKGTSSRDWQELMGWLHTFVWGTPEEQQKMRAQFEHVKRLLDEHGFVPAGVPDVQT